MQSKGSFIRPTILLLPVLLIVGSLANAPTTATVAAPQQEVATVTNSTAAQATMPKMPVFVEFRGVTIGMTADEVRSNLYNVKNGNGQDLLTFSEHESAQI